MMLAALVLVVVVQLVSADQQQQLALSSASADFSQRLYQKIALNEPTIVYSPYSIHSALSMTLSGSRGVTATQMKNTLGVKSMMKSLHSAYKELIEQYNSETNVHIHTGNGLFINPGYAIAEKFKEDTKENYYAIADHIKMSAKGGPEEPINDYIASRTENMIRDMLEPGSIDSSTLMVLVNTLFFNGSWETAFDTDSTWSQDFHQPGGAVVQVDMMHHNVWMNMKRDDENGVDVAELPFQGDRFSLYIALPQGIDGDITDLESLLAEPDMVEELFTGLSSEYARLAIPKFRIESSIYLNKALTDMGMVDAFSIGRAIFTGITRAGGAYISQVLHNAVIEIHESGTVAAAATAFGIHTMSKPTETFVADHPFVFFLRDKETGQILLQGKFSG